jgi:hypothetical protein
MDRLRRDAGASDARAVQLKRERRAAQGAGDDQASRRARQDAAGSSGGAEPGGTSAVEDAQAVDGAGAWQADAGLNSALGIEDGEDAALEPTADGAPPRPRDKQAGGAEAGAQQGGGAGAQQGGGAGAQQGGGAGAQQGHGTWKATAHPPAGPTEPVLVASGGSAELRFLVNQAGDSGVVLAHQIEIRVAPGYHATATIKRVAP